MLPVPREKCRLLALTVSVLALLLFSACSPATPPPDISQPWTDTPAPPPILSPTDPAMLGAGGAGADTSPTSAYGVIDGVIYENLDGTRQPAPGANLWLSGNQELQATTNPDGSFHITGLDPALYSIRAYSPNGESPPQQIALVPGAVATLDMEINIPVGGIGGPGELAGTITCHGQPVPGAVVAVEQTGETFTANENGSVLISPAPDPGAIFAIAAGDCAGEFYLLTGDEWPGKTEITIEVSDLQLTPTPPG